jgi:hypothetical protein
VITLGGLHSDLVINIFVEIKKSNYCLLPGKQWLHCPCGTLVKYFIKSRVCHGLQTVIISSSDGKYHGIQDWLRFNSNFTVSFANWREHSNMQFD